MIVGLEQWVEYKGNGQKWSNKVKRNKVFKNNQFDENESFRLALITVAETLYFLFFILLFLRKNGLSQCKTC